MHNESYYHQPMKFEEGNVFTCVCLSTGGVGMPSPRSLLGMDMSGGWVCPGGGYQPPRHGTRGGTHPLELTPSGSHHMYSQQTRVLLEYILLFLLLVDDLTRIYQHLISFTTEFSAVFFWLQSLHMFPFLCSKRYDDTSSPSALRDKGLLIITARKRSLRRLCFYTCLSVILFTGGRGVRSCWGGACVVVGGACVVAGGVHGCQGLCVVARGMHGCQGVCVVVGGVHG